MIIKTQICDDHLVRRLMVSARTWCTEVARLLVNLQRHYYQYLDFVGYYCHYFHLHHRHYHCQDHNHDHIIDLIGT